MLRVLYSKIDLLVVLALIASTVGVCSVDSQAPIRLGSINFLDDSWASDMAFKARQHVWLGREAVFSYGPLYQWLWKWMLPLKPFSLGVVYKSLHLFPYCFSLLLIYLTGVLLLRGQPAWKRLLYVLALGVFASPGDGKSAVPVCALSIFLLLVQGLQDGWMQTAWRAGAACSVVTFAFLFSADSGMYSLATLAIVTLAAVSCGLPDLPKLRRVLRFALLAVGLLGLSMFVLNTVLARPLDFRFWIGSYEMVSNFRWLLPSPMPGGATLAFLATIALCWLIFLGAWFRRQPNSGKLTQEPVFLLAGFGVSFLCLQTAVVRSDWIHVLWGLFPTVTLAVAVLLGGTTQSASWLRAQTPIFSALGLTTIFGGLVLSHGQGLAALAWSAGAYSACPPDTYYLDQTCLPAHDFRRLSLVSSAIPTLAAASDPILVYPYENIFGVVARRRVAGGVLQNYAVGGKYLTDRQLEALQQDKPPVGIYSADGYAFWPWPVDGVSNFTRTPEVWLYLQRHYKREAEPEQGVLLLLRDESRQARWRRDERELAAPRAIYRVRPGVPIDLGALEPWPENADFLKLRLTVRYAIWWKILKPSRLIVEVQLADGSHKVRPVVVQPNQASEIWIYPWRETQLTRYFSANPADWRDPALATPVSRLALRVIPIDWLSVMPSSIRVESVEAVGLGLE